MSLVFLFSKYTHMQCNSLVAPSVLHSYLSAAVLRKTSDLLYTSATDSAQERFKCSQEVKLDADFYLITRYLRVASKMPNAGLYQH